MAWPALSRNEDKGLVRYVRDELAQRFPLALAREDALAQADGRRRVAAAIYDALAQRGIQYALEPYDADARVQQVRPPDTVLGGAREGTCLDLALLYAGIALGKELAPLVVMLAGHALVAVSLDDGRRTAADLPRRNREGEWIDDGVLRDPAILRQLIDDGHYIAIECTGFAASGVLPAPAPEAAHRVDGRLAFDAAVAAGRAQLEYAGRPFRFAIDVSVLRDRDAFAPFDPPAAYTASPYQLLLDRLFDDDRLFGGRDDELRWLDDAIAGEAGGYAFVTGRSGSGKTALLVNWVRRLRARPPGQGERLRLAYAFISQKYELADQQPTLELLCQQLLRAHGRQEPLPDHVPGLQDRYTDLLDDPLPPGERLVVVIDALDEAQHWSALRFLFPHTLPRGVHVVFSAREVADCDWLKILELDAGVPTLRVAPLALEAVGALLGTVPRLASRAGEAAFVEALYEVSGGDPFYLKFLLEDLAALPAPTVADVKAKPAGLKAYLDRWWEDVAKEGKSDKSVRDLLSYLVVALGAIGRNELVEIDTADALDSQTIDAAVKAVRRYVIGSETAGYALCHPRFREYLVTDRIRPTDQRPYQERLSAWCAAAWTDAQFRYPLAHVVGHLAARRASEPEPKRPAVTAQMLGFVRDPDYLAHKLGRPAGLVEYEDDCRATVRAAVADPLPDALPTIASAALAISESRRATVAATRVFKGARAGEPEAAADQLPLIAPDPEWLAAGLLVAAWLCASRDRKKARAFLATQARTLEPEALVGTLKLLADRVRTAIDDTPEPVYAPPYRPAGVPTGVPPELAQAIVVRMGGASNAETIAAHLDPSMIGTFADRAGDGDEAPQYIAEGDSPWLVGFANKRRGEGESLIRRYIAAHAENPYGIYRNRSLWAVLGAVLCLTDRSLASDLARTICEAAYNPMTVEYREMLALAVLGATARLGDAPSGLAIAARVKDARDAAKTLHATRLEADTWGHHARRFSAIAEVLALSEGDGAEAAHLLDDAAAFPFGYAGYQAPASLALADANLVCRPTAQPAIDGALRAARRAAHNVQESRFCALTTARVNAIARRWRPGLIGDIAETVERFATDPLAGEFASVHLVGERYPKRSPGPNMLPIPKESLAAGSLAEIARDVYGVPVARLERLNPGVDPATRLPPAPEIDVLEASPARVHRAGGPAASDSEVNIADAGFAPLLAARFAAEVLGRREELKDRTPVLVAKLVPIAAASATALDLVLARLLLAVRPDDRALVERMRACTPDEWMRSPIPNWNVEA